jgi:hypothetical protein
VQLFGPILIEGLAIELEHVLKRAGPTAEDRILVRDYTGSFIDKFAARAQTFPDETHTDFSARPSTPATQSLTSPSVRRPETRIIPAAMSNPPQSQKGSSDDQTLQNSFSQAGKSHDFA